VQPEQESAIALCQCFTTGRLNLHVALSSHPTGYPDATHLGQGALVSHALELHGQQLLPVGWQLALVFVTNPLLDSSKAGAGAL
jgi:hypothetical protein